jgi:small conductance mechanosensitive channel
MKDWFEHYSTIRIADLISLAISYGIKLLIAIVLLIIGFWLINRLLTIADNRLTVRNFDATYKKFTRNLLNFSLKTVLIISILNFAGFRTTSVIALLGAAVLL